MWPGCPLGLRPPACVSSAVPGGRPGSRLWVGGGRKACCSVFPSGPPQVPEGAAGCLVGLGAQGASWQRLAERGAGTAFGKVVSPSSPCEELASEARRLPGTRGGGGPPHRLARRVRGPVVMEKERGSQWACARDPPRKQTEPSEGRWGGARKGGLNTVVGCEQLGPTAAGSLSRPGAGAGRGSVTGPVWGCGQEPCEGFFPQGGGARGGARGLAVGLGPPSARSPAGAPIASPTGGQGGWLLSHAPPRGPGRGSAERRARPAGTRPGPHGLWGPLSAFVSPGHSRPGWDSGAGPWAALPSVPRLSGGRGY